MLNRMMFRRWPLLSLAGLLAGCMLGPDFQRPDSRWLTDWRGNLPQASGEQQGDAQRQHDNASWWRSFNDSVLDALVAEAQRQNPGVRIAGLRILEAQALLGIAGSTLYPQLQQVNGELLRVGRKQSEGPDTAFTSYGAGFQIAWELDFWGRFRRGIESADAAYWASVAQYDDVQVLVAAQTASLYASIRSIELRLRIAQENAALQQRSLEITQHLFQSGNESELDVQQARTLYLSTLATIPELEAGLRQTQNALAVLLARPPGLLPELTAGREKIPVAELMLIVDLPAELLRRRPDVRAAEALLAAQSAQIGISEAEFYPSLTLVGSLGLSTTSRNESAKVLDWATGPTLLWNVFDWGRLENQVRIEDARFQQLYEQYQNSLLQAARELDDAALDFAKNRAQVEILGDAVKAARRSLDIATIQYREGLVDFERVLDSQRTLFSQQERLVATQSGVAQSIIAVYKALGGGWQPARAQPLLDAATRQAMAARVDWGGLPDAPLPAAVTAEEQKHEEANHEGERP